MSYFKDILGDIVMGVSDVAGICHYHEEPEGVDPVDYYDELICGENCGGRAVRDALKRIFTTTLDAGLGWSDGQAEICDRVVGDMLEVEMVEDEDWVLQLVCEVHD